MKRSQSVARPRWPLWAELRRRAAGVPPAALACSTKAAPASYASRVSEARRERKVVTVLFADLVGFTVAGRAARSRGRRGDPRPVPRSGSATSSSAGAARWRSSSATRWWRSSARRWRARTTPSGRCARRSRSATGSRRRASCRCGSAVNTGEALVKLDARPESGEGMAAGDVVNTACATASRGADERHPRRRGDVPRDGGGDRVPRGTAPSMRRGRKRRSPVWEVVQARARFGVDLAPESRTPLVGRRARSRVAHRRARARAAATLAGARHARRRAGNRQEPSRRRAVPVDRARRRADVLAPGPLAAVRPGRQLLGAGRDGEGAGGDPRDRQRRGGRRQARAGGRAADRGGRGVGAVASASAGRADARFGGLAGGGVRGVAAVLRGARGASARSCSSSRTSSGPTTACSTSSSTSRTGCGTFRC